LLKHLNDKERDVNELKSFVVNSTFANQYNYQVQSIYIIAYYLMLEIILRDQRNSDCTKAAISVNIEQQIITFFCQYTTSEADVQTLIYEFALFRTQQPLFKLERLCWEQSDNLIVFWALATDTTFLIELANRVYTTLINSVAAEQAFSVDAFIHSKIRNKLQSEKANKLTYIYINSRILEKLDSKVNINAFYSKEVHFGRLC
jgi:hypothetical protein